VAEFHDFNEWQVAVENQIAQAFMANGGALAFDPVNPSLGVSHVFHEEDDDGYEIRRARIDVFQRLMDFIWAGGLNPIQAFKRMLVITRCGSPQHLAHMDQTDVAVLLNETRAATSTRELAVWQEFMRAKGFFGKRPGMKGEDAKRTYAAAAKGNRNRKGGKKAIAKFSVLREEHAKAKRKNKRGTTNKHSTAQSDEA
jgi:hypothetical protein